MKAEIATERWRTKIIRYEVKGEQIGGWREDSDREMGKRKQ